MITAIVLLPLLGAILAGLLSFVPADDKARKHNIDLLSQLITCSAMVVSAVFAVMLFAQTVDGGETGSVELFTWIDSGAFEVAWSLRVDMLSVVMMATVTVISAMIHIYSIGYMHHDPSVPRFMAYLNLFTFFMLMLVSADNLLQLFFGWEGVGLASYLLIGFWYDRPAANSAAIKAFLVNRVGDFGFTLGILAVYLLFQSVHFDTIFAAAPDQAETVINVFGFDLHALTVISLLLFVGAMGKSAQLGLHTWLPDAMEGPTPVSALIHAATMVTAGVFMVARLSPLIEYSDVALTVIVIVGAATCLFAATVACVQNDIKRIIAYSTCSQLGYMFFACGVSAYSAGIFHLMTHAFFKALLFLGAGSVIHAMSDEQDIRMMGGLWKMIPVTYALMWIGSLALVGIWPFAGFYSKDIVLESAYASGVTVGGIAFWLGIIAAFLTAFYSWRLIVVTFHGTSRADDNTVARVHESPKTMLLPMGVLALGAFLSGYIGYDYFVGDLRDAFWGASIYVRADHTALMDAHHVPLWVKLAPLVVGLAGIAVAVLLYGYLKSIPGVLAERFNGIYRFLLNKWYFDELYDWLFVRPSFRIGRGLWKGGDGTVIDGLGPDGVAATAVRTARGAVRLQSGFIYHYAFAMLIGVVTLLSWYLLMGG